MITLRFGIFVLLISTSITVFAQDHFKTAEGYVVTGELIDGDTLAHIHLKEVLILTPYKFKNEKQKRRYSRLVRYVKKVYPYSQIIKNKLQEIDTELATIKSQKEKEKFIKRKEKELRQEFEGELTKLTITQGRILLKLVDRETGKTTYTLLKELKGNFSAVLWQSVARIFGSNLKNEYEVDGDDKMIEDIIIRIENGLL